MPFHYRKNRSQSPSPNTSYSQRCQSATAQCSRIQREGRESSPRGIGWKIGSIPTGYTRDHVVGRCALCVHSPSELLNGHNLRPDLYQTAVPRRYAIEESPTFWVESNKKVKLCYMPDVNDTSRETHRRTTCWMWRTESPPCFLGESPVTQGDRGTPRTWNLKGTTWWSGKNGNRRMNQSPATPHERVVWR